MLELYQSVLEDGRTPERVEVLMELTEALYEIGYDDHLDGILTLIATNDAVADIVMPSEELICSAAADLLSRLGVTVEIRAVYDSPRASLDIIRALMVGIEAFDDYESLAAIYESGEPDIIMISNLVAFVSGGFDSDYVEIIDAVSPKLIRIIKGVLTAKQLSDNTLNHHDTTQAERAGLFLATYPDTVLTDLLDDGGYISPIGELIAAVHIDAEDVPNYEEAIALAVTGLLFVQYETFDAALPIIDKHIELLVTNENLPQRLSISRAVSVALTELYTALNEREIEDESA